MRRVGLAAAVACTVLFVGVNVSVYVSSQMERTNWRAAAAAIGPTTRSRVVVATNKGQEPLAYYLRTTDFTPDYGLNQVRTGEIDTLGMSRAVSPPGDGFRLATVRQLAGGFWLRRGIRSGPCKRPETDGL